MPLFSQRKGYKPLIKTLQRERVDEELRNRLWNAIKIVVWDQWSYPDRWGNFDETSKKVNFLLDMLWFHFFKWPLDTRPEFKSRYGRKKTAYEIIRQYFFESKWYEVYDFIEFVIKHVPDEWKDPLSRFCNKLLETENAAYRIVNEQVVEITDPIEIDAIEEILDVPLKPVSTHIKRALELIADRKAPDYRNSIKESISAIEAICQYITGDTKASLGQALKKIKEKVAIHPALEKGFSAIYGFTSDSGGIRHALTNDEESPSYADAKFMLVACSSFINFLLTKAAEAGIKIE